MKYNIHNDAIRWRISNAINVKERILTLALTVFDMLTFQMLNIENIAEDQEYNMYNYAIDDKISTSIKVIARI